jgi:hypothetical protein
MKKITSLVGLVFICLTLISCGGGTSTNQSTATDTAASGGSESYTFDLTNRIAQAYPTKCTNNIVAFEVKFLKDGLQFVKGTDSTDEGPNGSCIAKETKPSEVGLLGTYAQAKSNGFIPCGGPVCTYAQLNATYTGTDVDGRAWTEVVSHVKNSSDIVITKSWLQGGTQQVSKVTLKFVDALYVIDLTDKTGSVYAMACKPPIVAFKLRFTSTGLGFTEGTDSVNTAGDGSCTAKQTPADEKDVIGLYAAAKRDGFIIPCGNAICTGYELNATYTGTDVDGRVWKQVVSNAKGSKEIFSTKSWTDNNGVAKEAASKLVLD